MIKESYLANMKNLPKDAMKIVVTRTAHSVLSPSWDLLNDYKHGNIDWDGYVQRFQKEMDNDLCIAEMRKIKLISKHKDIFLICYEKSGNCHRHILRRMIEELDEKVKR